MHKVILQRGEGAIRDPIKGKSLPDMMLEEQSWMLLYFTFLSTQYQEAPESEQPAHPLLHLLNVQGGRSTPVAHGVERSHTWWETSSASVLWDEGSNGQQLCPCKKYPSFQRSFRTEVHSSLCG